MQLEWFRSSVMYFALITNIDFLLQKISEHFVPVCSSEAYVLLFSTGQESKVNNRTPTSCANGFQDVKDMFGIT